MGRGLGSSLSCCCGRGAGAPCGNAGVSPRGQCCPLALGCLWLSRTSVSGRPGRWWRGDGCPTGALGELSLRREPGRRPPGLPASPSLSEPRAHPARGVGAALSPRGAGAAFWSLMIPAPPPRHPSGPVCGGSRRARPSSGSGCGSAQTVVTGQPELWVHRRPALRPLHPAGVGRKVRLQSPVGTRARGRGSTSAVPSRLTNNRPNFKSSVSCRVPGGSQQAPGSGIPCEREGSCQHPQAETGWGPRWPLPC